MTTTTIPSPLPFKITLRPCSLRDYRLLAPFHYRPGQPGPVDRCFGLYIPSLSRITADPHLIAVIVYSLPPLSNHLRNLATNYRFSAAASFGPRAILLRRQLRTISRVIVHPQFRSLGLATQLVRRTLPLAGTPYVEAAAVMGRYHPFFQKAGMTPYHAPPDLNQKLLLAAFQHVDIPDSLLTNTPTLLTQIKKLTPKNRRFLLTQIQQLYLKNRQAAFPSKIQPNLEWILPRLTATLFTKPIYYLWNSP